MFLKKTSPSAAASRPPGDPWRVLIVDDEPEVHSITRLALGDIEHLGRRIEFLRAESGTEARELLARETGIALAYVDVVMETDSAGLDLVDHIRNELGNKSMRIILRTGQPGMAPERQVIRDFDINDYMAKTNSSADKLYTATLAALRAYNDITTLERSRQQLERYRDGLETVIEATSNLFEQRSLRLFATGLLRQLGAMLVGSCQSMILRTHGVTVVQTAQGFEVLAAAGSFDQPNPTEALSPEVLAMLHAALTQQRSIIEADVFVGYFPTKSGIVNLLYLQGVQSANVVDLKLLDIFSKNISIAFENLYLDREIFETQSEIIATLGDVVETRSKEAANHVHRVAHLSRLVAEAAGLNEDQCNLIYMASPMHDIGKVAIPDSILLKPGPLGPEEWEQMKRHAQIGQEVFGRSKRPMLLAAAVIAGQHHERFDGGGYPLGLAGDQIDIFARIVALVDVFDALVHKRCYKPAWPVEKVVALLRQERGKHFDPHLVDCFLEKLPEALALVARFPDGQSDAPAETQAAPARQHAAITA
ncbi:DUF3369 domain-containing protein [soil metagenome]